MNDETDHSRNRKRILEFEFTFFRRMVFDLIPCEFIFWNGQVCDYVNKIFGKSVALSKNVVQKFCKRENLLFSSDVKFAKAMSIWDSLHQKKKVWNKTYAFLNNSILDEY